MDQPKGRLNSIIEQVRQVLHTKHGNTRKVLLEEDVALLFKMFTELDELDHALIRETDSIVHTRLSGLFDHASSAKRAIERCSLSVKGCPDTVQLRKTHNVLGSPKAAVDHLLVKGFLSQDRVTCIMSFLTFYEQRFVFLLDLVDNLNRGIKNISEILVNIEEEISDHDNHGTDDS